MRALTGNHHGDGAGAVPGFSSTQVRMERMRKGGDDTLPVNPIMLMVGHWGPLVVGCLAL